LKKEIIIFTITFFVLAIGMHFEEWLSHPIEHIMALPSAGAYGLGAFHPLIFTFMVYLIILLFKSIGKLLKRLF
jgi:hypothetical protein